MWGRGRICYATCMSGLPHSVLLFVIFRTGLQWVSVSWAVDYWSPNLLGPQNIGWYLDDSQVIYKHPTLILWIVFIMQMYLPQSLQGYILPKMSEAHYPTENFCSGLALFITSFFSLLRRDSEIPKRTRQNCASFRASCTGQPSPWVMRPKHISHCG